MRIQDNKSTIASNNHFDPKKTLHKHLSFAATEQYKLLRTNLEFTIPAETKCPVIGVTSAMRGDGKSTTSINLAYVLAEKGSKVLLIDGDLRLPSIAKKMEIANSPGLTEVLMDKGISIDTFKSQVNENWWIMPAGEIPPNPSELLGSKRMESVLNLYRQEFDYIIIDLPPANIVSDALSISSFVTGMVVVIRENKTEKRELDRCVKQFQLSNIQILGFVINGSREQSGSYKKYKHYSAYSQDGSK